MAPPSTETGTALEVEVRAKLIDLAWEIAKDKDLGSDAGATGIASRVELFGVALRNLVTTYAQSIRGATALEDNGD